MWYSQSAVNAIKHNPFTNYSKSPRPTAPPQAGNKSVVGTCRENAMSLGR